MEKLVSVIIPTYNREKTIMKAAQSVLNQSYRNLELIIVDDCSTDSTLSILDAINDSRLRVYQNNENKGANYSRNRGVSLAKGDYIAFQDSDDIWRREKLEKCLDELEHKQVDLVFSGMVTHRGKYKRYMPIYNLNDYQDKYHKLLSQNCVSTQTLVGKKGCFEVVQFDEEQKKLQDWDLVIRMVQNYTIYYIDEALVDVYMQNDSISMTQGGEIALARIYDKHKDYIDKNSDLKKSFLLSRGFAVEMMNGKGEAYFQEAYYIDKAKKTYIYYLLSKYSLFGVYFKGKELLRPVFSALKLWRV